jgi:hypothetical protein
MSGKNYVAGKMREKLKQLGLKASVTSRYSGWYACVDVKLKDTEVARVYLPYLKAYGDEFRSGKFDGMTDMFEHFPGKNPDQTVEYVSVTIDR